MKKWGLLSLTVVDGCVLVFVLGSESFFSEGLTYGAFVWPGLNMSLFRGFCIWFYQVSWDYHKSGSTFYVLLSLWRFLNHSGVVNLDPLSLWGEFHGCNWGRHLYPSSQAPQKKKNSTISLCRLTEIFLIHLFTEGICIPLWSWLCNGLSSNFQPQVAKASFSVPTWTWKPCLPLSLRWNVYQDWGHVETDSSVLFPSYPRGGSVGSCIVVFSLFSSGTS